MPQQEKKVGPKANTRFKIAEPIGEPVVVAFGEEGVSDIFPQLAEVRLAGGWLRIIVLAATVGAILGLSVAAMSWARWTACIGAAFFGLAMVIGQITAAQEHPFRLMRFVDIVFALTVGLVGGALYGVMAVGFIGAGLGAGAWILLGWLYRGINPPAGRLSRQSHNGCGLRRSRGGVLSQPPSRDHGRLLRGGYRIGLWTPAEPRHVGGRPRRLHESPATGLLDHTPAIVRTKLASARISETGTGRQWPVPCFIQESTCLPRPSWESRLARVGLLPRLLPHYPVCRPRSWPCWRRHRQFSWLRLRPCRRRP